MKDYLNSINLSKKNLLHSDDPAWGKKYPAFIINKCMSHHMDTIMYANEINQYPELDNLLQYDFFINTVRPRKRFSPWGKKEKAQDLDIVKQYYGYSDEKAIDALRILTSDQLDFIRSKLDTGG
ncbi:clamp loader [Cyanophage S-SSM2]|uniref:DNA polymerase clamp loader subunit n=3 Tax=Ahtivirus sagseatwo TaxID=2734079 RepID=A0A1D7SIA1_9CAUD|nr:clamp loader [Cyanophage S-SSM2]AOO13262.1 DNA polymerase clamp loader subunit [Cyanophage S-RIM14]AOO13478.1 DNA polymerase clamp loader subunit [Cyanophage S-RIM14]AOO13694.1 DNA polymerase clamp loader subunit [Cyanophage S-RIM14]AOO13910.1 DNA polymerase clamp loader subunit [Cyanophage S-RIM14]